MCSDFHQSIRFRLLWAWQWVRPRTHRSLSRKMFPRSPCAYLSRKDLLFFLSLFFLFEWNTLCLFDSFVCVVWMWFARGRFRDWVDSRSTKMFTSNQHTEEEVNWDTDKTHSFQIVLIHWCPDNSDIISPKRDISHFPNSKDFYNDSCSHLSNIHDSEHQNSW